MALSLIEHTRRHVPETWEALFSQLDEVIESISEVLTGRPIVPLMQDIFSAFRLTPLPSVSVVLVGQDPYPTFVSINGCTMPRATGLSFSVRKGDQIPPSLKNIYAELAATIPGWKAPDHGSLECWAKQGVLLLNRALTAPPGAKNTPHASMWEEFISPLLTAIGEINPKVIYLLWGREAQKIKTYLPPTSIVLEAGHPSSMNRKGTFRGCNHFSLVNEELVRQGRSEIIW